MLAISPSGQIRCADANQQIKNPNLWEGVASAILRNHTQTAVQSLADERGRSSLPTTANLTQPGCPTPMGLPASENTHPKARDPRCPRLGEVSPMSRFCLCALSISARESLRFPIAIRPASPESTEPSRKNMNGHRTPSC